MTAMMNSLFLDGRHWGDDPLGYSGTRVGWLPTGPAEPFFDSALLSPWRPRTDSNPQQQRSVLDRYLEVG